MRATIPVKITEDRLTSSTVAEPFVATAYDSGTAYSLGDLRRVDADYAVYEYLKAYDAAVTGKTPKTSPEYWKRVAYTETAYNAAKTNYALNETCYFDHRVYQSKVLQSAANPLPVPPETETDYWLYVGPTLRYAMFDLSRNMQTVGASPLTVVFTPEQRINTIGITGMSGRTLLLKVESATASGIIYPLAYRETYTYSKNECMTVGFTTCYKSKVDDNLGNSAPDTDYWEEVDGAEFDLNTRRVFDAYSYCFEPFSTQPTKTVFNVPPMSDAVVTVTLTNTAGNCKIGGVTTGLNYYLGQFLKPARNKGRSFSTVDRDLNGNAILVKRKNLPTLEGQLLIPSEKINLVLAARKALDAEPALFNGIDEDGDWTDFSTLVGVVQRLDIQTTDGDEGLGDFLAEEI